MVSKFEAILTKEARNDLDKIYEYIKGHLLNPDAVENISRKFFKSCGANRIFSAVRDNLWGLSKGGFW